MRRFLLALTLGVLFGLVPLFPQQGSALYCRHPRYELDTYPIILEGKVTKLEQGVGTKEHAGPPPDRVTLQVSRYFKGDGPETLIFMFDGIGWEHMNPVGSDVIMALRMDDKLNEYRAGVCLLRINARPTNPYEAEMRTLVLQKYGDGKPPVDVVPDPVPTPEPRGHWFLYGSLGALALLTVTLRRK